MERKQITEAFGVLGETLAAYINGETLPGRFDFRERLDEGVARACALNPWFTPASVKRSLSVWASALTRQNISLWSRKYHETGECLKDNLLTVAVIMAGNIPLVGMHDFLSVLFSGNRILVKMSENDSELLPVISGILVDAEPGLSGRIIFEKGIIKGFDAVIATGSDNTFRYFDYYFGKYPHIIRKNRNSVAVLDGRESFSNLDDLCKDIFDYFGMGCRSISKLFVPSGYDFSDLITLFDAWDDTADHNGYRNNYNYQKSLMIINNTPFIGHRNILLVEDASLKSPLAVLHYEEYENIEVLKKDIIKDIEGIQCVAGNLKLTSDSVPFGKTQEPALWDYADGVDTVNFLLGLSRNNG